MGNIVRADMVANVWKVVAQPGDTIDEDDPIVILESMKMEIPVTFEGGGVVKAVLVGEGDVVQEGQAIAELQ